MQFFFFILASNPVNTTICIFMDGKEVSALVDILQGRHSHCIMTEYRFSTSFRSSHFLGESSFSRCIQLVPLDTRSAGGQGRGTGDLPQAPAVPADPGWGHTPLKCPSGWHWGVPGLL